MLDDSGIAEIEQTLGVQLPEDYGCFLRKFGSVCWPDYIYGTAGGKFASSVVALSTWERTEAYPAIPHHLIPIYNDGWGNHDCLDTAQTKLGRCPVVFWNHELDEDQTPELIQSSFIEWLARMVAKRIKPRIAKINERLLTLFPWLFALRGWSGAGRACGAAAGAVRRRAGGGRLLELLRADRRRCRRRSGGGGRDSDHGHPLLFGAGVFRQGEPAGEDGRGLRRLIPD